VTFPDVNVVRRPGLGPCRNGPASGRASEQHRREQSLSASLGCIRIWLTCNGPVCRPPRSLVHWSGSSWTATPREGRSPPPAAVNSATLGRHHHHETGLRPCQPALPTTADVRPVLCGGTPALTARRHDVADRIGIGTRLVFSGPCDLSAWEIPADRRSDDADEPPRGIGGGGAPARSTVFGVGFNTHGPEGPISGGQHEVTSDPPRRGPLARVCQPCRG